VRPAAEVATGPMAINLEITGELWADPVNERLLVRTRIDLETGRCVVGDRAYGSEAAGPLQ
jgi:predicted component of type VI protein secretion system